MRRNVVKYRPATSFSQNLIENFDFVLDIVPKKDFVLVGTASNYLGKEMIDVFGEIYDRDIDISISSDYLEKNNDFENKMFEYGFVKGAVTEDVGKKRKRVLPNSYVLMKFSDSGKKEMDFLLGFHVSSPYFYREVISQEDIKEISEKRCFGNERINVLKFEYQIAEKLMLPEEKRVKSFDKLFQLALILDYRPDELAEEEALILKEYSKTNKLEKWWKILRNSGYIFGPPKIKRAKQRFFNELKGKLKL